MQLMGVRFAYWDPIFIINDAFSQAFLNTHKLFEIITDFIIIRRWHRVILNTYLLSSRYVFVYLSSSKYTYAKGPNFGEQSKSLCISINLANIM